MKKSSSTLKKYIRFPNIPKIPCQCVRSQKIIRDIRRWPSMNWCSKLTCENLQNSSTFAMTRSDDSHFMILGADKFAKCLPQYQLLLNQKIRLIHEVKDSSLGRNKFHTWMNGQVRKRVFFFTSLFFASCLFNNKILGADQSWICWKLWYTYKWVMLKKNQAKLEVEHKQLEKQNLNLLLKNCTIKKTKTLEFQIKKKT